MCYPALATPGNISTDLKQTNVYPDCFSICTAKYSNICCTLESSIGCQFGQDAWIYVSTHHYLLLAFCTQEYCKYSTAGTANSGLEPTVYSSHYSWVPVCKCIVHPVYYTLHSVHNTEFPVDSPV